MRARVLVSMIVSLLLVAPVIAFGKEAKSPEWCSQAGYHCLRVKYRQTWQSLFPDDRERAIMMRVNKTNQDLYAGKWLKVPNDLENANLLEYSPLPRTIDTQSEKVVLVDPANHAWGAYSPQGDLVQWGPATAGANSCQGIDGSCRTKTGEFRVYSVGSSQCKSSKFPEPDGGAPMPYCMFFNGGQALHGSPKAVVAGNASHGCVRMFVSDAEWLRYDFVEPPNSNNDYRGTRVIVLPYKAPLREETTG